MNKEKAQLITHLLNHAFNLLECDEHGYRFRELKEMIFNSRNLSSWLYDYKDDEVRDREDFLLVMGEIFYE